MKTKLLIGALILAIGFTSCTTPEYMTSRTSPHRHQGYKNNSDDYQQDGYYNRRGWQQRSSRGDYLRGTRYRRW